MTESQEIELGDEDMFDSGDAPEGLDTSIEAEGVPPSAGSEPDPGEDAEASLPASRGTSDPDFRSDYWAMQDKAEAGLSPIELDEDIYEFEIVGEDGEFVAAEDFFSSEEESTEEEASEPLSLPQDEFDTVLAEEGFGVEAPAASGEPLTPVAPSTYQPPVAPDPSHMPAAPPGAAPRLTVLRDEPLKVMHYLQRIGRDLADKPKELARPAHRKGFVHPGTADPFRIRKPGQAVHRDLEVFAAIAQVGTQGHGSHDSGMSVVASDRHRDLRHRLWGLRRCADTTATLRRCLPTPASRPN